MKPKRPSQRKKGTKVSRKTAAGNLSDRLSDIELKLDHIIERIRDSLFRQTISEYGEDEQ